MTRSQRHLDAWVTLVVVKRLSRPDALDLLAERPSAEVSSAVAAAAGLRARYREYEAEATAGRITAASWGRIEAALHAQIKAAERRARPRGLPPVLTEVAGPGAAARWETLSVPQRREIIRALLVLRVMPSGKGTRTFDPDRIEIEWLRD